MSVLAWHFVADTLRGGSPVPEDGETLVHEGPVDMCRSGLHASRHLIDALAYAPGTTICRVTCEDLVDEDYDKLVCRRRAILWRVDGENILRAFARACALSVVDLWGAPGVMLHYLQTGDGPGRAVLQSTAWSSARKHYTDGAWSEIHAAECAICSTQGNAVRAALDSAYAARNATRHSSRAITIGEQNRRLTAMVSAARGDS